MSNLSHGGVVVMMGTANAFAPIVFEKDHFQSVLFTRILLMLRICAHWSEEGLQFAPTDLNS